ncbi:MAG: acetyl-CoA C-acyltransferase [Gammaproteobacteria bacterium]|nr:acetyl-CoA C-acyltransferase [Gammaproteobacteria bacterium]
MDNIANNKDSTSLVDPVVIVSALRTPIGAFQGVYANISAPKLGGYVIEGLLNQTGLDSNLISEVLMGCVLSAGLGQAPTRQAAIYGKLSNTVPCTTVNKMCGSSLKTIVQAYNNLLSDNQKIIIAGGMENMTQAPYIIPKARAGLRLGHGVLLDHMFYDGLEDAYEKGCLMGHFAERTAKKYNFTRQAQDEFALNSANRAIQAVNNNLFNKEIIAVKHTAKNQEILINQDETPGKIDLNKISKLSPAFVKPEDLKTGTGTVTAANSSSISDGAAGLILMRLSKAKEYNLKPLAKIIGYSEVAQEPAWFTTAPVKAIKNLLEKLNNNLKLSLSDIGLFEINEAFAVVTMAAMHDLDIAHNRVNINGGACALGHPIGATGARIVTTLVHAMHAKKQEYGIASLCIGGGEAIALGVQAL